MTQEEQAYRQLVKRIADDEPVSGYSTVMQITLTDSDIAVVVAFEPDIVCDAISPVTPYMRIYAALAYACQDQVERERKLGRLMLNCVAATAKVVVLEAVQDECARRFAAEEAI